MIGAKPEDVDLVGDGRGKEVARAVHFKGWEWCFLSAPVYVFSTTLFMNLTCVRTTTPGTIPPVTSPPPPGQLSHIQLCIGQLPLGHITQGQLHQVQLPLGQLPQQQLLLG